MLLLEAMLLILVWGATGDHADVCKAITADELPLDAIGKEISFAVMLLTAD